MSDIDAGGAPRPRPRTPQAGFGGTHEAKSTQGMHRMSETHVVPIRIYLMVFFSLMLLTATTVYVSFVDLGSLNNVVALGIAVLKASLVILFFMHVRYSTRLTTLVLAAGVFWLVIMVSLTLTDYMTRGWLGVAGK